MMKVEKLRRLIPGSEKLAALTLKNIPHGLLNRFFSFPADLGQEGKNRVVDFLQNYGPRDLNHSYYALRTLWSAPERAALYAPMSGLMPSETWMALETEAHKNGPYLDRLLKLQYQEWLQDWALIRQDKNTMAHSLEYRLPFLDHRLIELAFRMPASLKIRGRTDKYIERRLADDIFPPHLARRKKIPFYLPVEYFLDQPEFKALVADLLHPAIVKARGLFRPETVSRLIDKMNRTREFLYCKQVMSLVVLELWQQIFVDRKYNYLTNNAKF
jgi:asparagine synthase (glutamine-hydrolysing)